VWTLGGVRWTKGSSREWGRRWPSIVEGTAREGAVMMELVAAPYADEERRKMGVGSDARGRRRRWGRGGVACDTRQEEGGGGATPAATGPGGGGRSASRGARGGEGLVQRVGRPGKRKESGPEK
jgi:hypothetical protein